MALEEHIDLEASDAFRQIDRIEAALTSAAQAFRVELGRAIGVLGESVRVDVEADTSGLAAAVEGAVDGADTTVTVAAETHGLDQAASEVDQLNDELEESDRRAGTLREQLGRIGPALAGIGLALGAREAFQFLDRAVESASDLEESASKAATVFGDAVDGIARFGSTAAETVGLAEQEALEFLGTFGNLLTAMGLAQDEAAGLSQQIVTLGADLASFNNLEVDEALEKLRSGLVGEIEPLRSLGISFNAAQVEAKAFELGIVRVGEEVSDAAKIQARWALITEQSSAAAGDFARTSQGLANQQRILAAEVRNAMARIGQELLPFVLRMVDTARGDLLPTLENLATTAMPLLVRAFDALSPAMSSSLTVLQALTPILELVVTLVEAIPDPVLQMATMFLLVRSSLGPLLPLMQNLVTTAGGLGGAITRGLSGVGGALTGLISPLGLASAAIGGAIVLLADYNRQKAEQKRRIDDVRDALLAEGAVVENVTAQIVRQRIETKNQTDDLHRLALSFGEVGDLAASGEAGLRAFLERLIAAGEIRPLVGNGLPQQLDLITAELNRTGRAADGVIGGNRGLVESFLDLQRQLQGGAREAIETRVAMEELSAAEAEAAIQANTAADGTVNYVAALYDLEEAEKAAAVAASQRAARLGPAGAANDRYVNSTDRVRDATKQAQLAMAENVGALEGLSGAYLRFGDRADELVDLFARGNVSAHDMALAMAAYGLSIEELLTIQDQVTEAVGGFVDTVVGRLDSLQSIVQSIGKEEGIREFVARFEEQATNLANFVDNIATLVRRGADDLAAALATAGPSASKAAAEAAKASDKELASLEKRYTGTANHLDAANRRMAETAPLLADNWRRATDMIEGVSPPDLASGIQESLDQAAAVFDVQVGPNGAITVQVRAGGQRVGEAFGEGFVEGIGNLSPHVGAAAAGLGMTAEEYAKSVLGIRSPSTVARSIGEQFVLGFALGLADVDPVVAAAENIAQQVTNAARAVAVVPAFTTASAAQTAAPAAAPTVVQASGGAQRPGATIQIGPNYETRLDPVQTAAAAQYLFAESDIPGSA